jgi:hypothetical protein
MGFAPAIVIPALKASRTRAGVFSLMAEIFLLRTCLKCGTLVNATPLKVCIDIRAGSSGAS